jgi:WhiB family redox-sensing transcriptional regulator
MGRPPGIRVQAEVDNRALTELVRAYGTAPTAPDLSAAACLDHDPEIFHPERGSSPEPARDVCAGCPTRLACLEWSLEMTHDLSGVWGGLTQAERQAELKRRRPEKWAARREAAGLEVAA